MKAFSLTMLTALIAAATTSHANYVAHEWGTFTSLVGSNGITQHGLYHEDEKLPNFVHGFGAVQSQLPVVKEPRPPCRSKMCFGDDFFSQNIVTQKMETPVIYFYGDPQKVSVNVRFPEGVVTDTFPAPTFTSPTRSDLKALGNGNTTFDIQILPRFSMQVPPFVPMDNIYGHARKTAANLIQSGNEVEKFIFYRGLGRFQPRFGITSKNGSLRISSHPASEPLSAFLVHVNQAGHGQLMNLKDSKGRVQNRVVSPAEIAKLKDHSSQVPSEASQVHSGTAARQLLVTALVQAGLYQDEALSMLNTWEHGYLKVPGLRILYVLPKQEVEEILPLNMTPAPQALERVFVGRIEVLLDTEEQKILADVLKEREAFKVTSLGRFAEAMLRRTEQVYVEKAQLTGGVLQADLQLLQALIQQAARAETESILN